MMCPKCKKKIVGYPATSRKDGSAICDECGVMEAMEDANFTRESKDEVMRAVRGAKATYVNKPKNSCNVKN